MIKIIMRDPMFLAQKSENATETDKQVVTDLLDTLRAKSFWMAAHCVGMAANMITKKLRPYQTEENEITKRLDYLDSNLAPAGQDHCNGIVI